MAGEVAFAYIGTSVEYTADTVPAAIVLHAEIDPALPVNRSVTFTWFKDRTAVTELSFYSPIYTITTESYYSRLFVRVGGGYPITGTYSCLIEDSFVSEIQVGMEILQSTICKSDPVC